MHRVLLLIAWGITMRWCPATALRDTAAEMHESAGLTKKCDMTHYGSLSTRYKDQRFAGEGAHGCVIFARDSRARNVEVAIKIAKQTGRLKEWKLECARARSVHEEACKAGGEAKMLVERYIPTCLEVGGTNKAPYIVMQAASGQGIDEKLSGMPEEVSAAVFAQIVGALAAMHGVGLSHNDLHEKNVVILDRRIEEQESPLVALINFGKVVPVSQGVYEGGYKQDENLLAREAYQLALCPESAAYPLLAEEITEAKRDARIQALFTCLREKWSEEKNHSKKSPDEQFFNLFQEVIVEAWENQNWPSLMGIQKTKVLDLYHTEFIQANQPALHQFFPSASAGICGPPTTTHEAPVETAATTTQQRVTSETTSGESKQVEDPDETWAASTSQTAATSTEKQEKAVVDGRTTTLEVVKDEKQDIKVVDGAATTTTDDMVKDEQADTTTMSISQTTKNVGKRRMVCSTLLLLVILGPAVNSITL